MIEQLRALNPGCRGKKSALLTQDPGWLATLATLAGVSDPVSMVDVSGAAALRGLS